MRRHRSLYGRRRSIPNHLSSVLHKFILFVVFTFLTWFCLWFFPTCGTRSSWCKNRLCFCRFWCIFCFEYLMFRPKIQKLKYFGPKVPRLCCVLRGTVCHWNWHRFSVFCLIFAKNLRLSGKLSFGVLVWTKMDNLSQLQSLILLFQMPVIRFWRYYLVHSKFLGIKERF